MLSAAAVSRADQRDQDSARQARQMTEQMKSSVNVWLLLQAVVLSLLAFVLVRPLTNTLLQAQEAGTGPEGHGFGKTLRDSVFKGLYRHGLHRDSL